MHFLLYLYRAGRERVVRDLNARRGSESLETMTVFQKHGRGSVPLEITENSVARMLQGELLSQPGFDKIVAWRGARPERRNLLRNNRFIELVPILDPRASNFSL